MRSNLFYIWVVGLRSHLLQKKMKGKHVVEKSSYFKMSSRLLAYTYTCVLCTHIQIHVCRDLVHLDSSGPPGVSSRPLGSQPSTPRVQPRCVCVCACTHTYLPPGCDPWIFSIVPTVSTAGLRLTWKIILNNVYQYKQFYCSKTWLSHFRRARGFIFDDTRGLYQTSVN